MPGPLEQCVICLEVIERGGSTAAPFMMCQHGNNLHCNCFLQYLAFSDHQVTTCLLCDQPFSFLDEKIAATSQHLRVVHRIDHRVPDELSFDFTWFWMLLHIVVFILVWELFMRVAIGLSNTGESYNYVLDVLGLCNQPHELQPKNKFPCFVKCLGRQVPFLRNRTLAVQIYERIVL